MAIVHDILGMSLRGRVGDLVYKRGPNGSTIVCRRPTPSRRPPTDAQIEQRQRFACAAAWARAQLRDPERQRVYEARAKIEGLTAYGLAVREFMTAD